MTKEIITRQTQDLTNISDTGKLLSASLFRDIDNRVNLTTLRDKIKTPIEKRLKESKFAQLIREIPDNELKVLALVMGFSPKGLKAIKMFLNAENSGIQIYALKHELMKRT